MGPKCPCCKSRIRIGHLARRHRKPRGTQCAVCGAVFRLYADGGTFAAAAGLAMLILVLGAVAVSLISSTAAIDSSVPRVLLGGVLIGAVCVGAWTAAKTRRLLPAGDRCAACGYDISGCRGNECPECGVSFFVKPPVPGPVGPDERA